MEGKDGQTRIIRESRWENAKWREKELRVKQK